MRNELSSGVAARPGTSVHTREERGRLHVALRLGLAWRPFALRARIALARRVAIG